jgi:hypothetical protein
MRPGFVVLLLTVTLLAGCAGKKADNKAPEVIPQAFEDVKVTATTGAIRGIVVDDAIRPVSNATIKLMATNTTRKSDNQGAFVFTDLAAGDYFISVTKKGYLSVQASATVQAGVASPSITKVQLKIDAANQPFTELLSWQGYFACGFGTNSGGSPVGGVGVNPCAVDSTVCDIEGICLLGSSNTHDFLIGGGRVPDLAQAEAVWEGSQPLGNNLNMGWFDSGTADFKSGTGPSPLVVPATHDEIVAAHGNNVTDLLVRIFPGTGSELTITLQQRFTVYVTYFYGFVPRDGWAFSTDGACASPEQCGA